MIATMDPNNYLLKKPQIDHPLRSLNLEYIVFN